MNIPLFRHLKTLHARFLLALILVGIIPFILVELILVNLESDALTEQSTRELTGLARGFAGELDTFVQDVLKDAEAIAGLPDIASMDPARQEPLLVRLHAHYGRHTQLATANLSGQLLAAAVSPPIPIEQVSIAEVKSFQTAAYDERQDWWVGPALSNDSRILHIHTPIRDASGKVVGVLGSPVSLPSLSDVLEQLSIGGGGRAFVLDETGRVLLHPDPAEIEKRRSYAAWISVPNGGLPSSVGTAMYTIDGETRTAGYAPIPNLGWTVVVDRPEAEVLAPTIYSRNLTIVGVTVIIILSVLAAIILASSLTRPVRELAVAARAFGAGDSEAPLPENVAYDNELQTLVTAFAAMRKAVIDREAGLRRSEAKNRTILNAIPDILFYVRGDGTILDFKAGAGFNNLVANSAELVGKKLYHFVSSSWGNDVAERILSSCDKSLETGEIQIIELEIPVNGHTRDYEIRFVPSSEDEVLIIIEDITEWKQAEATIRKHLSALEASIDGIAIFRDDTHVYLNDAYAKLYGYDRARNLIAKTWHVLYEADERDRIVQEILPIVRKKGHWRGEAVGKRRDDTTFYQEISLTRIETGEIACVVRDITERKDSEEALRQAQKLESLGILAGGIAHDFNNLLTGMLGHATLAQMKLPPDSPIHEHIGKAIMSAGRAADLTRQMLAYAGKGQFQVKLLDLNELTWENASLLETALPKQAELVVVSSPNLPLIKADTGQIQQVLMNLVINAAEALQNEKGQVTIKVSKCVLSAGSHHDSPYVGGEALPPGTYVCLEVIDTGIGMDTEMLGRIFDPFFTTKVEGRGLGLSATLGIIRTHGGGLQLDSKLGEGTTFRVFFPATDEPRKIEDDPGNFASQRLTGKVLVIDDEAPAREVAHDALNAIGLQVLTATNGHEGLELFKALGEKIDVILLDLKMPVMDGEETYRRLAEMDSNINVIVCTGYSETEVASHFPNNGKVSFLQKPYRINTLITRVQELVISSS